MENNTQNINCIHPKLENVSYPKFTKLKWYPEPFLTLAEFFCVVRTEFDEDLDVAKKAYRFFFNGLGWNIEEFIQKETRALLVLRECDPQNWKLDLVSWAANGILENLAEVREMIWLYVSYDPTDENSYDHQTNNTKRLQILNQLTSWKLCAGCHSELIADLNEVDTSESKPTSTLEPFIIKDPRKRLATNMSLEPDTLLQAMRESERNVVLHVVKQIDRLSRISGASPAAIINEYFPHMGMERRNVFLTILAAHEEGADHT